MSTDLSRSPRKWTKDQVRFVMGKLRGPKQPYKDVARLCNERFPNAPNEIDAEHVKYMKSKYKELPAAGNHNPTITGATTENDYDPNDRVPVQMHPGLFNTPGHPNISSETTDHQPMAFMARPNHPQQAASVANLSSNSSNSMANQYHPPQQDYPEDPLQQDPAKLPAGEGTRD
ncbi:hypothetical protein GE09DRAFT_1196004 [Coniochaeta sp. 2T2.1]|nr:hypothetical protein GE09DRAFT_1196004 [Coniochaeta sp. 2T2.1]